MQAYEDEGRVGQTVRHYYYKLISSNALSLLTSDGGEAAYGFVVRLLVDARRKGMLPWYAIVDPGRRSFDYWSPETANDYAEIAFKVGRYELDIWRGQPCKIELWCEKDGQAQFLSQAAYDYRVPVYITKGYSSFTVLTEASQRIGNGDEWVILYCGDFDPTGLDIERNLREELRNLGSIPMIERIALTQADLPTLPAHAALSIKRGDTRAKQFIERYGTHQKCYELEAMPAATLLTKVKTAIEKHMDMDALREAEQLEAWVTEQAEAVMNTDIAKQLFADRVNNHPSLTEEKLKYLK